MKNAAIAMTGTTERKITPLALLEKWSIAIGIAGFALLTWAGARLSIPVPGALVPGTLQLVPVLLAGLILGARAGSLSQLSYLGMGMAGLPVFALPGSGPAYLLGPTGGFLIGFLLAPWVVGRLAAGRGLAGRFLATLAGAAVVHLCGFSWLLVQSGGDAAVALFAGFVPFFLFDLSKVIVVVVSHAGWLQLAGRLRNRWSSDSFA
jgi:biotin transport system substrate-specific component